jgi:hypothetical protein
MTAPWVPVQFIHVFYESGAKGIEVDVPDQFHQICFFFTNDGFVAVLKKMTGAFIFPVECNGISCQQTPHKTGKRYLCGDHKEVEVVGHERPGITLGPGIRKQTGESPKE